MVHKPLVLQMMEALSNLPELERRVVEQSEIGVTYGRSELFILYLFKLIFLCCELFPFNCVLAHKNSVKANICLL